MPTTRAPPGAKKNAAPSCRSSNTAIAGRSAEARQETNSLADILTRSPYVKRLTRAKNTSSNNLKGQQPSPTVLSELKMKPSQQRLPPKDDLKGKRKVDRDTTRLLAQQKMDLNDLILLRNVLSIGSRKKLDSGKKGLYVDDSYMPPRTTAKGADGYVSQIDDRISDYGESILMSAAQSTMTTTEDIKSRKMDLRVIDSDLLERRWKTSDESCRVDYTAKGSLISRFLQDTKFRLNEYLPKSEDSPKVDNIRSIVENYKTQNPAVVADRCEWESRRTNSEGTLFNPHMHLDSLGSDCRLDLRLGKAQGSIREANLSTSTSDSLSSSRSISCHSMHDAAATDSSSNILLDGQASVEYIYRRKDDGPKRNSSDVVLLCRKDIDKYCRDSEGFLAHLNKAPGSTVKKSELESMRWQGTGDKFSVRELVYLGGPMCHVMARAASLHCPVLECDERLEPQSLSSHFRERHSTTPQFNVHYMDVRTLPLVRKRLRVNATDCLGVANVASTPLPDAKKSVLLVNACRMLSAAPGGADQEPDDTTMLWLSGEAQGQVQYLLEITDESKPYGYFFRGEVAPLHLARRPELLAKRNACLALSTSKMFRLARAGTDVVTVRFTVYPKSGYVL